MLQIFRCLQDPILFLNREETMIVFIPLAVGQYIPNQTIESLGRQTLPMNIMPCVTEGIIKSDHTCLNAMDKIKKLECECNSRNMAKSIIDRADLKDEFFCMQDKDIVQLYSDNYHRGVGFLRDDKEVGCVALTWENYPGHVWNGSIVIRREVLRSITFRTDKRLHVCMTMKDDIEALGFKCCTFPSDKRLVRDLMERKS